MKQNPDRFKWLDSACAAVAVILCLAAVIVFWNAFAGNRDDIEYPLKNKVNAYDPYVQQFDSLKKGLLWIDYPADPRLDGLENVYDYSERTASKIYYLWDRAYYNGHYYSYFGIAPVITVYMPYHILTGNLPGSGFVMTFFCLIAAVFIPLSVFQWAWDFAPRTPRWLLLIAAPAVFWGSLILLIARGHTPFYFVACAAANAFLSAFIWFCLRAYSARSVRARCALYAGAGICFGLLFQSRINVALMAAFLVIPGLWFFIIGRQRTEDGGKKIRDVLLELISLGTPVLLFICGSMIFNALRFSGPLDFGTDYQLTVADVSTYKFRLRDLPYALYHYFLDPPAKSDVYPYISFSYVKFTDYGHYLYRDAGLGLLSVPLCTALLLSPAVIFHPRFRKSLRVMCGCAVLGLIFTSLLDFCLGGVIYRYTSDLTLIASFTGMAVLVTLTEAVCSKNSGGEKSSGKKESGPARSAVYYACCALVCVFAVISIAVCIRICLINGNGNIVKYSEEVSAAAEKFLPFKK